MTQYTFKGSPGPWSIATNFGYDTQKNGARRYIMSIDYYSSIKHEPYVAVYSKPLPLGEKLNIIEEDEAYANAQAIASAPQMIKALQRVLQDIPDVIQAEALDYIEEALAEATTPPT